MDRKKEETVLAFSTSSESLNLKQLDNHSLLSIEIFLGSLEKVVRVFPLMTETTRTTSLAFLYSQQYHGF